MTTRWTPGEAEAYLHSLEPFGIHFGLERMHALTTALGLPQDRFATIHVVGTNGKSSVTRMLATILAAEGLRAGAYLSPHLVSFTERVLVGDRDVDDTAFAVAVQRVAAAAKEVDAELVGGERVTQFEALTAAAFEALAAAGVEVAVIEAGLGGRLDATNVIASRVQVLTNVALEHTQWLGSTVAEIAAEKTAVVRPQSTLVVGADLAPEALAVASRTAAERDSRVLTALAEAELQPAALGDHQRRNLALAVAAAEAHLGRPPSPAAIASGAAVSIPGRLQTVERDPQTIIDGAHNPAAMVALAHALRTIAAGRRTVACVSILSDKDAEAMLRELLPHCAAVVACVTADPRALAAEDLAAVARRVAGPGVDVLAEPDPLLAVGRARVLAGPGGLVVATGSLTLAGELVPLPVGVS